MSGIIRWRFISVLLRLCVLLIGVVGLGTGASAQTGCHYYASPTGTGNGLSPATPFKVNNFWAVAAPGKTLCLLDGAYSGSESMIDPPDNLSGTQGNPITVRALNDGAVRIDGGGRTARHRSHRTVTTGLLLRGLDDAQWLSKLGSASGHSLVIIILCVVLSAGTFHRPPGTGMARITYRRNTNVNRGNAV